MADGMFEGETVAKRQKLMGDIENETCTDSDKEGESVGAWNSSDERKDGQTDPSGEKSEASAIGLNITARKSISEKDAGILEYVSCLEGFHGVLKQRYVDFLVNERDLEGNLIRLTNTTVTAEEEGTREGVCATNNDVLSEEDMEKIREVLESNDTSLSATLNADEDKEHRAKVHRAIRAGYASVLDSDTVEVDGKKAVRVFRHQGRRSRMWKRGSGWPADRGNYCRFTMYKENKDTMDAINLIAKLMKIKTGAFTYAGTKDRRAVTAQQVSVYRVEARRLQALNKTLRNIVLGNFEYCTDPLRLGDLSGNHFVITLRNVTGLKDQIDEAMNSFQKVGFINYFGLQRFGNSSIATHTVGCALLHSHWSEAVDLILSPRPGESADMAEMRQYWLDTKDAEGALKKLGHHRCIEATLLEGLVKHGPKDLVNSLQAIPRNTRLMYVHAYQSYVWNFMVSRRIKELGLKPVTGDIVLSDVSSTSVAQVADEHTTGPIDCLHRPSQASVHVMTDDDITSGKYTIYDVVMPLPGYDIIYPGYGAKDWYSECMSRDGLDIDQLQRPVKDYSLSGAYRRMLIKPPHVTWHVMRYDDVKEPLVLTDLDRSRGQPEPSSIPDGKFQALRLEFTLPTSCYATMAIREVLKCDTSAAHQASQNVL